MPWFLALQGPTHRTNESTVYQLAESAAVERLRQQLLQEAAIGGVVSVPAVFGNHLKPITLYVRPSAWGLWTFYELSEAERKELGNTFLDALNQAMRQRQGVQGLQGAPPAQGLQGIPGAQGTQGVQGTQGRPPRNFPR
ncbi:MAG: hypothetical protein JOY55_15025 [Mycobacterium sp.]|nr:hypothetical protein [Mycobacterium sp.]